MGRTVGCGTGTVGLEGARHSGRAGTKRGKLHEGRVEGNESMGV